jgi:hypothetical protein
VDIRETSERETVAIIKVDSKEVWIEHILCLKF